MADGTENVRCHQCFLLHLPQGLALALARPLLRLLLEVPRGSFGATELSEAWVRTETERLSKSPGRRGSSSTTLLTGSFLPMQPHQGETRHQNKSVSRYPPSCPWYVRIRPHVDYAHKPSFSRTTTGISVSMEDGMLMFPYQPQDLG